MSVSDHKYTPSQPQSQTAADLYRANGARTAKEQLLDYLKGLHPACTPYSDPQDSYDTGFYRAIWLVETFVKENKDAVRK